jgi:hypothetical protein
MADVYTQEVGEEEVITLSDIIREVKTLDPHELESRGFHSLRWFAGTIKFLEDIMEYIRKCDDPTKISRTEIASIAMSRDEHGNFVYGMMVEAAVTNVLFGTAERIAELGNPTIEEVVENEIRQEKAYRKRYEAASREIDRRYGNVSDTMEQEGVNSTVTKALEDQKRRESVKVREENTLLIISYDYIFSIAKDLVKYKAEKELPQKVVLKASIGYDPRAKEYDRKKALRTFADNNGRNVWQRAKDWTRRKVDGKVIATLLSIEGYDPCDNVSTLAGSMIDRYEETGSFAGAKSF